MLARAIVLVTSFLAGSAIADSVHGVRNITAANITVVNDGGNSTFTTVIVNATYVYNATEAVPTPTTIGAEVWTSTLAPMNTSTACFCSIPASITPTENQTVTVQEPTPANMTVTVLPTAAVAVNATTCPCQVVSINQTVFPTTQAVGPAAVEGTAAQNNNLLLNANSGIMEIASVQLAAISIFFGLVGAGVTLL
ncbi:hypothetical protein M407DRAFT_190621 [Tulasnella calospora MUT 4182]|uniref:Uncharacterized protein n=1 Tax=Tulasnella calospora MUT 4182 TaxID=1051891 RepID=A0A0C3M189_9AGAM|nr:hypothetical protein M407DRAFT_190621 [Tulasnella calospora MUT 4182]